MKGDSDDETEMADVEAQKTGTFSKLNCCKKDESAETNAEKAAGKVSSHNILKKSGIVFIKAKRCDQTYGRILSYIVT